MPVTLTNGGNDFIRSRNSGEIHGAKFKFKTAGEREKQTDKRLYSKQHDLI